MLNKPDEQYPLKIEAPVVLGLLLIFAVLLAGVGSLIADFVVAQFGIADMMSFGEEGEKVSYTERMGLRWANLITHSFLFSLSALLTAYLVAPKKVLSYLAIRKGTWWRSIPIFIVLVIASYPVILLINWLNHQLPLPDWMWKMESQQTGMIEAVLQMDYPIEFWFNLLIIAVIPAIGEELFFRGIIQQSIRRWSQKPHLAIWVAAILFSAIHLQFAGFFPRMILGALLGYLFLWSGNLLVPIIVHFFFNAFQVVGIYQYKAVFQGATEIVAPPVALWLTGLFVVAACLYYLKKQSFQ